MGFRAGNARNEVHIEPEIRKSEIHINPYFVSSAPNQEEMGEVVENEAELGWNDNSDRVMHDLSDIHVESNVDSRFKLPENIYIDRDGRF